MKTLVILSALFAFAQTSALSALHEIFAKAAEDCAQEKSLDLKHFGGILKENILPEDNPEFTDFFQCYWTKLDVIKADNTFNDVTINILAPGLLTEKFPSIVDPKKVAGEAIEHCKDTPKAESLGLTGIKMRNCLLQYAQDHQ